MILCLSDLKLESCSICSAFLGVFRALLIIMHRRLSCDLWSKCPYVELLEAAGCCCPTHQSRSVSALGCAYFLVHSERSSCSRRYTRIFITEFAVSSYCHFPFTINYNTLLILELDYAANNDARKLLTHSPQLCTSLYPNPNCLSCTPIVLSNLPAFPTAWDLVMVSLYARVLHCLLLVSGKASLDEYLEAVTSFDRLYSHACLIIFS